MATRLSYTRIKEVKKLLDALPCQYGSTSGAGGRLRNFHLAPKDAERPKNGKWPVYLYAWELDGAWGNVVDRICSAVDSMNGAAPGTAAAVLEAAAGG